MSATELAALQSRLRPLGRAGDPGEEERTIVVMPSFDLSGAILERHAALLPALEDRFLYLLLLLRRPGIRIVLLSSRPVPREVLDYQLGLVPPPGGADAAERLVAISPDDGSPRALADKLLERDDLVERIAETAGDPGRAFIAPYNVSAAEARLALRLGLPLYAPDSRFYGYGTKTGSRRLFAAEGVAHPAGREGIAGRAELRDALTALRAERPGLRSAVVKLNDSVYGEGNRVLDLTEAEPDDLADSLPDWYVAALARDPGIVEEMIEGDDFESPSVQMRIIAGGGSGLVCTHDQLLDGQTFVGCRFPADPAYAVPIAAEAAKLRRRFAREGIVGRFGVDFVVVRDGDRRRPYAVEVNLREGGTSHPFGTLYLLTDGRYDEREGAFRTPAGDERHYTASDDLAASRLPPAELVREAIAAGLAFEQGRQTGVVFHMLRALPEAGKVGVIAIGASRAHADELYDETEALVWRLAERRTGHAV